MVVQGAGGSAPPPPPSSRSGRRLRPRPRRRGVCARRDSPLPQPPRAAAAEGASVRAAPLPAAAHLLARLCRQCCLKGIRW